MTFDSIQEFYSVYSSKYTFDKCSCGGLRELILSSAEIIIDDHRINIIDCPILQCLSCGDEQLGNLMPQEIYNTYYAMQKQNALGCKLTSLNKTRFDFAEHSQFIYDCRDLNIPGLNVDHDHPDTPGFSCPVFFDRKVLSSFLHDDDYALNFFSESYGSIAKKGSNGWLWEWDIVFGINKNNRVIIFLGDLDQIDREDRAIFWLKSYNTPSDHQLVDTELYQAQFNNTFSKPIVEKRILRLRDAFYAKIEKKYGFHLFHLEQEAEELAKTLRKPINYFLDELTLNIVALDRLLNEAIDCDELRKLFVECVSPIPKNYKDLKTRKLLVGIIATRTDEETANSLVSPLFHINDLRTCFAHLIPQHEIEVIKTAILKSYQLDSFENYRKLYDTLIERIYKLYQYLIVEEF